MTNRSQIKEPDDLRFIANHPVFFYAALGDVRKRGAKGAGLSVVWFLGDGQITGIDVLSVIDRHLRADLQKRRFARNGSLDFTGRFAKTRICP